MNIVDSSGWLEYFSGGQNVSFFEPIILDTSHLLVPSVSIYEVFKRILQQRSENDALIAVSFMQQGQVIDLNTSIALRAAKLSADLKLPMADSIIYATAREYKAILWTQDQHFLSITGVRYIRAH